VDGRRFCGKGNVEYEYLTNRQERRIKYQISCEVSFIKPLVSRGNVPPREQDNLRCDSLLRLESYEAIEIKWRAMTLQVKKDPNGMGQDFPDQAMLKMPQIIHSQAGDSKALCQMRAHGFHALAQAGADFEQRRTMGRGHPFARGSHHQDAMSLRLHGLPEGIDKPFIGRE
jgi:hypothetical protein